MYTRSALFLALSGILSVSLLNACSSESDSNTTPPVGNDAGKDSMAEVGMPETSMPDSSTPGNIFIRVAHLSPDAPAVDFCVKENGQSAFTGPVLKSLSVSAGAKFAQVTRYFALPEGTYTVRLVAPNAANCESKLGPEDTTLPKLSAGTYATGAAVGLLGNSSALKFQITPYVDNLTTPAAGKMKLRFIHTAPGIPAVDVGVLDKSKTGSDALTTLFSNVAFPAAATNAYVEADPVNGVSVGARVQGTSPAPADYPLVLDGVKLDAGTITTVFAVGQGSDQVNLQALICDDKAALASASDPVTTCALLPEFAHLRVAHLSPDAPAVDVCVKAKGAADSTFKATLGLGTTGLVFKKVSKYLNVPPGEYEARLIAPGASCATALAGTASSYALPKLEAKQWATVAAIGKATGASPNFTIKALIDTHAPPASGKAHLRFTHASPSNAVAVNVGTLANATATALAATLFGSVNYGEFGKPTGSDTNGFLPADAPIDALLGAAVASSNTLVWRSDTSIKINAGDVLSLFAVDGPSGKAVDVVACADRTAATDSLAPCSVIVQK